MKGDTPAQYGKQLCLPNSKGVNGKHSGGRGQEYASVQSIDIFEQCPLRNAAVRLKFEPARVVHTSLLLVTWTAAYQQVQSAA